MPTLKAKASRAAPRALALLWAAWDTSRVFAYLDTVPPQLATIYEVSPVPLWTLWAAAAVLLTLGALVPGRMPECHQNLARQARGWGLALSSALVATWAVAFLATDISRGWVSSSNYIMLLIFAWISALFITREFASVNAAQGR